MGLRLNEGIDILKISKEFDIDLESGINKKLEQLISGKLLERDGTVIRLTRKGMDLANAIIVELL